MGSRQNDNTTPEAGDALAALFSDLRMGKALSADNLIVVPLFGDASGPGAVLLEKALADGLAEVGEIGEHGDVPRLRVRNRGPDPVLILDGEELVGAKQNRIVNTTILVPGKAAIDIPVSCVEHGRWSWRSRTFASSGRMLTASMRAGKTKRVTRSVMTSACYDADQGAVWDDVAAYAQRRGVRTLTGAYADVYEKDERDIAGTIEKIQPVEGQTGLAGFVNRELVSLDVFGQPEAYAAMHRKLLGGLAAEAIDRRGETGPARRSALAPVLRAAASARRTSSKPPGLGTDVRFAWQGFHGAALVADGGVVHVSVFPA